MENKYFTPDIEDLYVGYKLEIKGKHDINWQPVVLGKDVIWHQFTHIENLGQAMEQLRVPYLTKEQIEAEGWRQELIYPNGTFIMMLGDKHKGFECMFADGDTQIVITRVWSMYDDKFLRDNIYKGNCKCINQFRLIIKLLGI